MTASTSIFSQPSSPARIDRCDIHTKGDDITLDATVRSTGAEITYVDFSLGMYDANLALHGTDIVPPDWQVAQPSRNVHVNFGWDESVDGHLTKFVNCAINSVKLADGRSWTQPVDYTDRDWRGIPIRH